MRVSERFLLKIQLQNFNDQLDKIVDNELYQTTSSVDRFQQKAENKEYAVTSVAVFADVNKKKEKKMITGQ